MPSRYTAGARSPLSGGTMPRPGAPVFACQFAAGDRETRAVLQDLATALAAQGISAEDISNTELVLAEVLNNIAEHAYADGTGTVELTVACDDGGGRCTITDHGRPMPQGMVPSPPLPTIEPPDHLPEGGFGWHIIRCLTTDLSYHRAKGANTLSMFVPWGEIA